MEMGLLDHVEQRGEQRGMQLGVLQGQRELLRQQLEARFGHLPAEVMARLHGWPGERLTELGRALLSATSLEELGLGASASRDS